MKKKIMIAALCACAAISLAACGSNEVKETSLTESEQQEVGEQIESDYAETSSALDSLEDTINDTMDSVVDTSK